MTRSISIDIAKEYLHFSAAHFTVFSATERENLHGHNFQVQATLRGRVGNDGLCFDYNTVKAKLKALCDALDEIVLLPGRCPHLEIRAAEEYTVAAFNDERLPFLHRDVKVLPVRNVTVEELAHWLIGELTDDHEIAALPVTDIELRVSSGAGQWACATWTSP